MAENQVAVPGVPYRGVVASVEQAGDDWLTTLRLDRHGEAGTFEERMPLGERLDPGEPVVLYFASGPVTDYVPGKSAFICSTVRRVSDHTAEELEAVDETIRVILGNGRRMSEHREAVRRLHRSGANVGAQAELESGAMPAQLSGAAASNPGIVESVERVGGDFVVRARLWLDEGDETTVQVESSRSFELGEPVVFNGAWLSRVRELPAEGQRSAIATLARRREGAGEGGKGS